eukprot:TRINITY_DN1124_c0_g1_i3.p1 TRINITY_DN1124_c0_g1~~TRINITY_DN1124_c0_g1_i3.p1  ORF type:complete len:712 (-),score=217.66 TRINITY_DN1124_c0_g1_i3:124-2019(-)
MDRSVVEATQLMVISIILILVFLGLSFANWTQRIHSHVLVGLGGLLVIVFSTFAAIALGFWMGVMFTALTALVVFLMLGVGVDNLVLLYTSFERVDPSLPLAERNAQAMGHAGAFMCLTSGTTALCFAVGSTSVFPIIEDFCFHAALVVAFNLLYDVTVFDVMLVLSAQRALEGKRDCIPCTEDPALQAEVRLLGSTAPSLSNSKYEEIHSSYVQRFFDWYAPYVGKKSFKIGVLVVFATLFSLGVYSATIIEEGMEPSDVLPSNSYVNDFFDRFESDFPDLGVFFSVVTGEDVNYADPEIQAEIRKFEEEIIDLPSVSNTTLLSVWRFFDLFDQRTNCTTGVLPIGLPVNITQENRFVFCLSFFIENVAPQFSYDVLFEWTGPFEGRVKAARFRAQHEYEYSLDSVLAQEALTDTRDLCKQKRKDGIFPNAFPYAFEYLLFEAFSVVWSETLYNFLFSLSIVLAVMLLFVHAGAALVVCLVIISMDVEIVGWIPLAGLKLDNVTSMGIVMAVGIAVDYSIHIVHAFLVSPGTRDEKAVTAVQTMGRPLISGALSTFLGVIMLVFGTVPANYFFFLIMLGIVTVGIVNGLVLLPVLLSLIGPSIVISSSNVPDTKMRPQPVYASEQTPLIN